MPEVTSNARVTSRCWRLSTATSCGQCLRTVTARAVTTDSTSSPPTPTGPVSTLQTPSKHALALAQ